MFQGRENTFGSSIVASYVTASGLTGGLPPTSGIAPMIPHKFAAKRYSPSAERLVRAATSAHNPSHRQAALISER